MHERKRLFTRTFVLLLATQTCFGMSVSVMFLLPKYLKLALHASDVEVGWVGAVGAVTGVFAFPLVGHFNDCFGRKPFLLLGSVLMALTTLTMLAVEHVEPTLYVIRALQGISFALLFNSASTLASDGIAPEQMGRALGIFGASMLVTNALSPYLCEPLADRWGWDAVFWFSVAWAVLSLVTSCLVRERHAAHSHGTARPSALALLGDARARRVVLIIAAAGAGFGAVFTFSQPYALALGIREVSGFFVSYAVCALCVRLALVQRLDRYGKRRVCAAALSAYALAVCTAAFIRPGVLELVGALMGLAQGIYYPMLNALALESVPRQQRGSMMALYHGGFNAGVALLLLIGGSIADKLGYPALFFMSGALTALGALSLYGSDVVGTPA